VTLKGQRRKSDDGRCGGEKKHLDYDEGVNDSQRGATYGYENGAVMWQKPGNCVDRGGKEGLSAFSRLLPKKRKHQRRRRAHRSKADMQSLVAKRRGRAMPLHARKRRETVVIRSPGKRAFANGGVVFLIHVRGLFPSKYGSKVFLQATRQGEDSYQEQHRILILKGCLCH